MARTDSRQLDVTHLLKERDTLRRQIRLLEERLQDNQAEVLDNASSGVVIISAFRILYANRACLDIFGLTAATCVQNMDPMSFLAPHEWARAAQLIQATSPGQLTAPLHKETTGMRSDGSTFPMLLTITVITDQLRPVYLCHIADVSNLENHEISTLRSIARKRIPHDAASMTLWNWLPDRNMLVLDAPAQGRQPSRMHGARATLRVLLRTVHDQDRPRLRRQILVGLRTGVLSSSPFRYADLHGRSHVGILHGILPGGLSLKEGMVGVVRNLGEYPSQGPHLARALAETQNADLAKTRFISNISHELRTPLNGILGMLQLLGGEPLSESGRRFLAMATLSGTNLLQIINDLLELAEIEQPPMTSEPDRFSPCELIIAECSAFTKAAEHKGLTLTCHTDLDPGTFFLGHTGRLSTIIRNLLSNSIKFTASGSITLYATILHAVTNRHRLLLCVTDTGIGIPDHKLNTVFEPFCQADESPNRIFQGAGLGLGLIRRTVERLNGTLSISSEEGVGTTVCITVDLVPDPPGAVPPSCFPDYSSASESILLAEDNIVNQVLAETVLNQLGYKVRPVQTGHEVLKALDEEEFACVLMDIQMPEMSGIEATRRIRSSNKPYARIPIIAMTAHAMQGDRERMLASGMDGYLSKPFSLTELRRLVETLTGTDPGAED